MFSRPRRFEITDAQVEAAVRVNGVVIPKALLDFTLRGVVERGQEETAYLFKEVREELINLELMAQEALRRGLDKSTEAQSQLYQAHQQVLSKLLLKQHLQEFPVVEEDIVQAYHEEIEALGEPGFYQQYRLRLITQRSQAEARATISFIRSGGDFEKAARERSLDGSRSEGGLLDWVILPQVLPPIADVIIHLPKGAMTLAPIKTPVGWNIVRVEDLRPYEPPSFEASRDKIREALIQKQRGALLEKLHDGAEIL
jgi:peptidyl-prolyl cis-trans isomerase C